MTWRDPVRPRLIYRLCVTLAAVVTGAFLLPTLPASANMSIYTNFPFGNAGDKPISGDWNGDGHTDVGVYRPSNETFYLRLSNSSVTSIFYGNHGDVPITGDWNADGKTEVGVYRPGNQTFYERVDASTTYTKFFGNPGDVPIVGDWNGFGFDEVGVYRPSNQTFYEDTGNNPRYVFGNPGDVPLIGDWDYDGKSDIAVYRPGQQLAYLRISASNINTCHIDYANPAMVLISGHWSRPSPDALGLYSPSTTWFELWQNSFAPGC